MPSDPVHRPRRPILALLAGACLVPAGCGLTGGEAGGDGAGAGAIVGSRAMPEATVSVSRAGADASAGFIVTVDPPTAVAALEVLSGSGWESATPVDVVALGEGTWRATLPAASSATGLLVRVRLGDGSILETGPADLALR